MANIDTGYGKPEQLKMARDLAPELANGPKWQRSAPIGTGCYMPPKLELNGFFKKVVYIIISAASLAFGFGAAWATLNSKVENVSADIADHENRIRTLETAAGRLERIPVIEEKLDKILDNDRRPYGKRQREAQD